MEEVRTVTGIRSVWKPGGYHMGWGGGGGWEVSEPRTGITYPYI